MAVIEYLPSQYNKRMREPNMLQLYSLIPNAPLSGSIFAQERYHSLANVGIMMRYV